MRVPGAEDFDWHTMVAPCFLRNVHLAVTVDLISYLVRSRTVAGVAKVLSRFVVHLSRNQSLSCCPEVEKPFDLAHGVLVLVP